MYDYRDNFLNFLRQVFTPDACEALICGSILDKVVFCLIGKQDMFVK